MRPCGTARHGLLRRLWAARLSASRQTGPVLLGLGPLGVVAGAICVVTLSSFHPMNDRGDLALLILPVGMGLWCRAVFAKFFHLPVFCVLATVDTASPPSSRPPPSRRCQSRLFLPAAPRSFQDAQTPWFPQFLHTPLRAMVDAVSTTVQTWQSRIRTWKVYMFIRSSKLRVDSLYYCALLPLPLSYYYQ